MAKYTEAQKTFMAGVKETASNLDGVIYVNPNDCADILKKHGIDYHSAKTPADIDRAICNVLNKMNTEEQNGFIDELYQTIHKSLDKQIPGAGDAFFGYVLGPDYKAYDAMNYIRSSILTGGVSAVDKVEINGKNYGYTGLPTPQLDTKEELLRKAFSDNYPPEIVDAIIKNMPGDDAKWLEFFGRHEGGHLDNQYYEPCLYGLISEEHKADAIAIDTGDAEFARALRSFRALNTEDYEHASSAALLSYDPIKKSYASVAKSFETDMYDIVSHTFGFQSIEKAKELLQKDPDAFFEALNKKIDEKTKSATSEYKESPESYTTTRGVLEAQIFANFARSFEYGYKRYALGRDLPEPTPLKICLADKEAEESKNLENENAQQFVDKDSEIKANVADVDFTTQNHVANTPTAQFNNNAPTSITEAQTAPETPAAQIVTDSNAEQLPSYAV